MATLNELKLSSEFTKNLIPDDEVPTVEIAKTLPIDSAKWRRARVVHGNFTWVLPEVNGSDTKTELIGVSKPALKDLGIAEDEIKSNTFSQVFSGKKLIADNGPFPWSQAYAGFQFGVWAGQLGDGRAISLFEVTNAEGERYEVQLKGSGRTPYSRFADGKAVLRSSVREALGSEAVNALGIPTTRALCLIGLPELKAQRERGYEPTAVVTRFAESWIRLGTFNYARAALEASDIKRLADYCIDEVLHLQVRESDRYRSFYKEVVLRNAKSVGLWQTYGLLNGVLNTDNTSILGLSIDYGPFAFMGTFDASFSPNHDDGLLRYAYKNVPSVIWWNLEKLSIDIESLLTNKDLPEQEAKEDLKAFVDSVRDLYIASFRKVYFDKMRERLALRTEKEEDFDGILTPLLQMMEDCGIEYNRFFRLLGNLPKDDLDKDPKLFIPSVVPVERPMYTGEEAEKKAAAWLKIYKQRINEEGLELSDQVRKELSNKVNPNFVLHNWILDEVIEKATNGDYSLFQAVMEMSTNPFNETWGHPDLEQRYLDEIPRECKGLQCSCSS